MTQRSFWTGRVASLLSVLPLGVWTVNHLWDNLAAFRGPDAWQKAVTEHPHPVAYGLTLTVVLLPLVIHTVWGIGRLFSARPNVVRYPWYNNLKYALQRASAVGLLGFLGAHLWLAFLQPRLVRGEAEPFADIAREMRFHGPTLWVYVLGILAVAYHLGNGLSGFAWTWGLTSGRRSFRGMDRLAIAAFVLLLGLGWGAVYALWRAGAAYG
jgi:succinate dehydrogenase / fumarate reductase cytochrome b subunit